MNFDAKKDYRQAVKFYQQNVVSKPEAEEDTDAKKGENEAHKKPYPNFNIIQIIQN